MTGNEKDGDDFKIKAARLIARLRAQLAHSEELRHQQGRENLERVEGLVRERDEAQERAEAHHTEIDCPVCMELRAESMQRREAISTSLAREKGLREALEEIREVLRSSGYGPAFVACGIARRALESLPPAASAGAERHSPPMIPGTPGLGKDAATPDEVLAVECPRCGALKGEPCNFLSPPLRHRQRAEVAVERRLALSPKSADKETNRGS
jgi:hypothetical protein